jgi:hypothetical protein
MSDPTGGLTSEEEQLIRECSIATAEAIAGPLDLAEVQADWERFRAERLPVLLAEARDLPDEGDARGRHLVDGMSLWCHVRAAGRRTE